MSGIDYGRGQTNIDKETGIRYGVINQNEVLQSWCDSSEPDYGQPGDLCCGNCGNEMYHPDLQWGDTVTCDECGEDSDVELPDCCEPMGYAFNDGEYEAFADKQGDIFILKSPFYTLCRFCSPCAPGAGFVMDCCEDGIKAYCFGHDWFDDGIAPYPVYRVGTDEPVVPEL